MTSYVGQGLPRVEDRALLRGAGRYVDDLRFGGMLHVAILGSPHAHARVRRVDTSAAERVRGVVRAFTGEEIRRVSEPLRAIPRGWTNHALAVGRVRYVGEPVAAVVASSRYAAEDGRDRLAVEYEPLPAVVDPHEAVKDEVLLHPARGTNVLYHRVFTYGDVEGAFERADRVVGVDCRWGRASGNPIETGGCVCRWDSREERMAIWTNMQTANFLAALVAAQIGLSPDRLSVRRQPTGGSFGSKVTFWKYVALTGLIARQLPDRPVKFLEDRLEHLRASSSHGPDRWYHAEAAVGADGRITALRVRCLDDLGAYSERRPGSSIKPLASFSGCYEIPALEYDLTCVVTNKCPQGSYRGYGVHAHNFVLERLVDEVAAALALDPLEIRRRNFIAADRFPYVPPTRMGRYDSGDYDALARRLCEMADYAGLRRWQAEARAGGRLVGIGVATTVEMGGYFDNALYTLLDPNTAGPIPERVELALAADGSVEVQVGYGSEGQGQDTVASQLAADALRVSMDRVRIRHADSTTLPQSFGTGGSRMAVALAGAIGGAAAGLRAQILGRASVILGVPPEDLELRERGVQARSEPDRWVGLSEVAAAGAPPLRAGYTWPDPALRSDEILHSYLTAAGAAHLVVVEVEPETGQVRFLDYWIVDDCGAVLNPAIVDGITQGAVAQGIGQVLYEEYVYDEQGQLLTGTWLDYLLPTAREVPDTRKARMMTPSPYTPYGIKGVGEGAMNTTPAAVANAISDALRGLGIEVNRVPVRPHELWAAIREGRRPGTPAASPARA